MRKNMEGSGCNTLRCYPRICL